MKKMKNLEVVTEVVSIARKNSLLLLPVPQNILQKQSSGGVM